MFARRSLGRWVLLFIVPAGCGTSLVVAEQTTGLDAADGGLPRDAGVPPVDAKDAVPDVVTVCGNALCENRVATVGGTQIVGFACCRNPRRSQCGIVGFGSTCLETDQEGNPDPSCVLPLTLGAIPGCCRTDGRCGVM